MLPCTDQTATFFSVSPVSVLAAKTICVRCDLRAKCLAQAMRIPYAFSDGAGVWGGTTPGERRQMRREALTEEMA
ncbi:MAG: WhiB family transcriptional regulator [Acidimicrobiales bacterium]